MTHYILSPVSLCSGSLNLDMVLDTLSIDFVSHSFSILSHGAAAHCPHCPQPWQRHSPSVTCIVCFSIPRQQPSFPPGPALAPSLAYALLLQEVMPHFFLFSLNSYWTLCIDKLLFSYLFFN